MSMFPFEAYDEMTAPERVEICTPDADESATSYENEHTTETATTTEAENEETIETIETNETV